ncbi:MAG: hypothetical protein HRT87_08635 [Legionellales bacterium]|nr:hypothetical protein [Legionellales bacterium]
MHQQITENYDVPSLNNDDIKNSPGIPDAIADYMGLEYWHSKSDSKLTRQMKMLTTLMHLNLI